MRNQKTRDASRRSIIRQLDSERDRAAVNSPNRRGEHRDGVFGAARCSPIVACADETGALTRHFLAVAKGLPWDVVKHPQAEL